MVRRYIQSQLTSLGISADTNFVGSVSYPLQVYSERSFIARTLPKSTIVFLSSAPTILGEPKLVNPDPLLHQKEISPHHLQPSTFTRIVNIAPKVCPRS